MMKEGIRVLCWFCVLSLLLVACGGRGILAPDFNPQRLQNKVLTPEGNSGYAAVVSRSSDALTPSHQVLQRTKKLCSELKNTLQASLLDHPIHSKTPKGPWSSAFRAGVMESWFEALDPWGWVLVSEDRKKFSTKHSAFLYEDLTTGDCSIVSALAELAGDRLALAQDRVRDGVRRGIISGWKVEDQNSASHFVQREVIEQGGTLYHRHSEKSPIEVAALWRSYYQQSPLFTQSMDAFIWAYEAFLQGFFHSLDGVSSYLGEVSYLWKTWDGAPYSPRSSPWPLRRDSFEVPSWASQQCSAGGLCSGDLIVALGELSTTPMVPVSRYLPQQIERWLKESLEGSSVFGFVVLRSKNSDPNSWQQFIWSGAPLETLSLQGKLYTLEDQAYEKKKQVGVIEMNSGEFSSQSISEKIKWLIYKMKTQRQISAWVLDLRRFYLSPSSHEVVEILHLFSSPSKVVGFIQEVSGWEVLEKKSPSPPTLEVPLVVLLGPHTSSSGQWLAKNLQRLNQAVVVGSSSKSHGWLWQPRSKTPYLMPRGLIHTGDGVSLLCQGVALDVEFFAADLSEPFYDPHSLCLTTSRLPQSLEALASPEIDTTSGPWQGLKECSQRRIANLKSFDVVHEATQVALDLAYFKQGERGGSYKVSSPEVWQLEVPKVVVEESQAPILLRSSPRLEEGPLKHPFLDHIHTPRYALTLKEQKASRGDVDAYEYKVVVCLWQQSGACTEALRKKDGSGYRIPGAWLAEYSYDRARSDQQVMAAQHLSAVEERRLLMKSFGRGLIGGGISGGATVNPTAIASIAGFTMLDASLDATAGVPGPVDQNVGVPKAAGITSLGAILGTITALSAAFFTEYLRPTLEKRLRPSRSLRFLKPVVGGVMILLGVQTAFFSDSEKLVQIPLHPFSWINTMVWGESTEKLTSSWVEWTKESTALILEEHEVYRALGVLEGFLHSEQGLPLTMVQSYCLPHSSCVKSSYHQRGGTLALEQASEE